jgi:hypothetical protein
VRQHFKHRPKFVAQVPAITPAERVSSAGLVSSHHAGEEESLGGSICGKVAEDVCDQRINRGIFVEEERLVSDCAGGETPGGSMEEGGGGGYVSRGTR